MKEITNRIINRIPNFYTRDDRSVLLAIIDSIVPEIEVLYKNIDVVSDMISINKVHDDDLFNRFGSMLNVYKYSYETDDMYRSRIVASVAGRCGGIISSIKGAIASYIGLFTDIDKYIYICGSWEYDNRFGNISNIDKSPGNMVCAIDPDILVGKDWVTTEGLIKVINNVKASGVNVYTTYVFCTLYDDAIVDIDDQYLPTNIVSNISENQSTKIYDNNDRLLIHIGLVSDDAVISIDDINSLLNNNKSLLNSSFILNKLSCYDVIDGFLSIHQ